MTTINSLADPLRKMIWSFAPESSSLLVSKTFISSAQAAMVKEWGSAQGERLLEKQRAISPNPPTNVTISACFSRLKVGQNQLIAQAKEAGSTCVEEREKLICLKYGKSYPIARFMEVENLLQDADKEMQQTYEALWFGRPIPGAAPNPNTGIFDAFVALNIVLADPPQNAQEIREWLRNPANQNILEQITHLNLASLNMTRVPKEISRLANLHTRLLSNNEIRELPSEITELRKLIYLDLMNNRFTQIPQIAKPALVVNIALNPIKKISEADYKRWNSILNTILPFDILYANLELEEFPLAILVREICKLPAYVYGALLFGAFTLLHSFVFDLLFSPILPDFLYNTLQKTLFFVTFVLALPIVAWGILSAYLFTPILLPFLNLFGYASKVQVKLGELA